jgi:hypothetical protein
MVVEGILLDLEREVMEALTPAREETLDEAARLRALDQLELPVADVEVAPPELAIVSGHRLDAHDRGQEATETGERGRDRGDRDRDVVDPHGGKAIGHRSQAAAARKLRSSAETAVPSSSITT